MTLAEIAQLIQARGDEARHLRDRADKITRRQFGDGVYVRGIIEFSSYCSCNCCYCGLRADNSALTRYRLTPEQVAQAAREVETMGVGTVVLQSGEDPWWTADRLARLIAEIKQTTSLAVTLSVGERERWEYAVWRDAGADRYLLRHETIDPELYARMHPGASQEHRIACLEALAELGYQVGAGSLVGLPGQTVESLAEDLLFMKRMNLHMGGIGPVVPHPGTPLGATPPGSTETAVNMMALLRILIPDIMLPATTSLETSMSGGRLAGLHSGANVIMPNLTPRSVAAGYEIYPGKRAPGLSLKSELQTAREVIAAAGRHIADGPGHSPRCAACGG